MEWISAQRQIPPKYEPVLVYTDDGAFLVAVLHDYLGETAFYCGATKLWNVTHWMPLPDKPLLADEKEMCRRNYAAMLENLGYNNDGTYKRKDTDCEVCQLV